jgi:hypothetical protein
MAGGWLLLFLPWTYLKRSCPALFINNFKLTEYTLSWLWICNVAFSTQFLIPCSLSQRGKVNGCPNSSNRTILKLRRDLLLPLEKAISVSNLALIIMFSHSQRHESLQSFRSVFNLNRKFGVMEPAQMVPVGTIFE